MFGKSAAPARARDEGEKPFWISFADLMTAMMILFLVVMVASLSSVTQRIQQAEQGEKQRGKDIAKLCQDLKLRAGDLNSTIVVDCRDNRISFGEAGRFGHNQYFLNSQGQQALQDVVPLILDAADSEEGRKWLKQVVIEGFTDTDGSYLYNLHLSLQRSEWVMCSLLDSRSPVQKGLSAERQQQIRSMFLAGGVSFNNAKESKEESRRVELRMQFFGLKDQGHDDQEPALEFAYGANEKCQLEMRQMSRALSSLSAAIASGLQRQNERSGNAGLSGLVALKRASTELSRRFDQVEKALAPPREKRLLALGKFKREQALTSSEWRLVFAGLADDDEVSVPVLEDDQLFDRVHREVADRIEQRSLSRRDWLALCFSYFAYDEHKPDDNANWRVLRDDIDRGFDAVRQRIGREKEWMRIVAEHRELFGAQAGIRLAEEIFEGRARDLSCLQAIAQVPDSSWLWQRIFAVLLSRIFLLDDETFLKRLPELVALGQLNTRYLNQVLSACLTRYHRSRYREQSSSLLKQAALEHWGSPQMRSKQNAWLQYVEQPVCAMVVAWFAKEDLEHFFTLLKGEAEVDQSRLFYWLRFANQMSYTRIVMGGDAWHDRGSDFVAFREKNNGRLSQLTGGPSHNNAVVMQIGNYFFVEFSGTGNACYVYRADAAPFNPDKQVLGLATELKQQGRALKRMSHSPAPRRPNVVEGWLDKFDDELRALGIVAQRPASYTHPRVSEDKPTAQSAASASVAGDSLDVQVKSMLGSVPYKTFDHRSTSGVYQVLLARDDTAAKTALLRLGFKAVKNNALMFWRL